MTEEIKTQVLALIAAQEKYDPNPKARRDRIAELCRQNPLPVAQAILRMLLDTRTKNEVRGRYKAADNLIELTDAAADVIADRI